MILMMATGQFPLTNIRMVVVGCLTVRGWSPTYSSPPARACSAARTFTAVWRSSTGHACAVSGRTVWINGPDGGSIARFGLGGIDIHRTAREQAAQGACLYCTHTSPTRADWDLFVDKVRELYGIEVGEEHRPDRLK